ncbi:MAG TPA: DMT family transporter [Bacteroidota bacterium]
MNTASSTIPIAAATMLAFASNSILCRLALLPGSIDAGSFTIVRLLSGALILIAITAARKDGSWKVPHWRAALALFCYAAPFSYAYVRIPVGVGALVLFPAVQLTMIGWDIARGKRLHLLEWSGLALAMVGLVVLTLPGVTAPDPIGAGLMATAGISWGMYSLIGRGNKNPGANTASNFLFGLLFALPLLAFSGGSVHVSDVGLTYAIVSGSLASGLGYVLWYRLLPRITATQAGILQLLVPVLAALAGVMFLGEPMTNRLVFAGAAIIGGVALAVVVPTVRTAKRL